MFGKDDKFFNLAERLEEQFQDIDGDACEVLGKQDDEYASVVRRINQISKDYPIIDKVTDGEGEISLTAEEHAAFVQYFELWAERDCLERKHLYFCGHTDCLAYLQKIDAI